MTSDEALENAIDILGEAKFNYGCSTKHNNARAKVAQTWLNIAEYLRQEEQ